MSPRYMLFSLSLIALVVFGTLAWADAKPDKNNEPENATSIEFGDTLNDTLGEADHIDYFRFVVAAPETQGKGKIALSAKPGELLLYLYDANRTELYKGKTSDGELTYEFTSDAVFLRGGAYYIAVFLSKARNDENSYSIKLTAGGAPVMVAPHSVAQSVPIDLGKVVSPWPSERGYSEQTGRSRFNAPSEDMVEIASYDMRLSLADHGKDVFGGLRVGTNNMLYIFNSASRQLLAYSVKSGMQWKKSTESDVPPSLDEAGYIYIIDDLNKLTSLNPDGTVRWTSGVPSPDIGLPQLFGGPILHSRDVCLVGWYIYVSSSWESGSYITAFN